MGILWTLIIGFLAGVIAKFLHPGPNEPSGFIVTTLLGIAGAFVATYLGQAIGWAAGRRSGTHRRGGRSHRRPGGVGDDRAPRHAPNLDPGGGLL